MCLELNELVIRQGLQLVVLPQVANKGQMISMFTFEVFIKYFHRYGKNISSLKLQIVITLYLLLFSLNKKGRLSDKDYQMKVYSNNTI